MQGLSPVAETGPGSTRNAPLATEAKGTLLTLITALRTAPTGGVITPIAAVIVNKNPQNTPVGYMPPSPEVGEASGPPSG